MHNRGGTSNDPRIQVSNMLACREECASREECRFYMSSPAGGFCYLWKGDTCVGNTHGHYRIYKKSCGDVGKLNFSEISQNAFKYH